MAQRLGQSEISVEVLLAAIDHPFVPDEIAPQTTGLLLPAPHEDMPFSREAIAALAPFGEDVFSITTDQLRGRLNRVE